MIPAEAPRRVAAVITGPAQLVPQRTAARRRCSSGAFLAITSAYAQLVLDIGICATRIVAVTRSESSSTVFMEFRGLRDAPHVTDKDTRVRIALSVERAEDLRRRLAEVLPEA